MQVATDIHEVVKGSPHYPVWLREIPDAPDKLYVRGNFMILGKADLPILAVVGTRKPTPYGLQVVHKLISQLAGKAIIVSGLAYGIDAKAHEVTIENGGITWAVLGSGLDDASIYPSKHLGLAHKIMASGGCLVSEYPSLTPPLTHHFPMRNRIIAGVSDKILVIEAPSQSGALITAKAGLEYNREILVVPGPIFSEMSKGTNQLISEGAVPVLEVGDILEIAETKTNINLTDTQSLVYKALMSGAKHLDELADETNLGVAELNSILTLLEMRGLIIHRQGRFVATQ